MDRTPGRPAQLLVNAMEVRTWALVDAVAEPVAPDDPAAEACRSETRAAVRGLLGRLTPLQRECLTMRFLLGFSVKRTAAQLGRSPEAVRALQFRAMRDLATSGEARPFIACS